jgi:hypothetical protein
VLLSADSCLSAGFSFKDDRQAFETPYGQNNVFGISLCNGAKEETDEKHANCLETFTSDVIGSPGARVSTN